MLAVRDGPPAVGAMAGPVLVGYFLNWGLFGVLCVQVFLYYLAFPRDRWTMKSLVYGLLLLDAAQSIFVTHEAFEKYGLGFGNVKGLAEVGTGWLSFPIISAINATAVQLFFAHRIMKLSESKILGLIIAILAITGGAAGLTTGVQAKIINNLPQVAVKARIALTLWLTTTAACDLLIAVVMTVILSKKRNGFNTKTDDVITKIIRLTVETGSLTAALAIVTVILYFVFPHASYWNAPLDFLGKLYSNNLLVILNSRMKISDGTDSEPRTRCSHFNSESGQTSATQVDMPVIKIQREVWSRDDSSTVEKQRSLPPLPSGVHPYSAPATHHMV